LKYEYKYINYIAFFSMTLLWEGEGLI